MEVLNGKQFRLPLFKPLGPSKRLALRTMAIAARVVSDTLVTATITFFDMAAKRGGATALNSG